MNECCKVSFSIGKYMDAKHSGKSNLYQLDIGGIKYTLVPFTRKNQPKALQVRYCALLIFTYGRL